MQAQQKRVYRIEKYLKTDQQSEPIEFDIPVEPEVVPQRENNSAPSPELSDNQYNDIMDMLKHLKQEITEIKSKPAATPADLGFAPEELEEALRLRAELKEIYDAIEQTKVEILTIHQSGVNGMEIARVTDELDAIVAGTESATETILESAELIDQVAADLAAAVTDETLHGLVCDVQDKVINIFESCNFQDLTGQRIGKVVSAFRFIEERVIQMMEIWGGVDSFSEVETFDREDREGDRALLNGPALDEDMNVASQDDIDALFD